MVSLQYETFKPIPNMYEAILGDINTNQTFKDLFGDLDQLDIVGKVEDIIKDLYNGLYSVYDTLQTLNN